METALELCAQRGASSASEFERILEPMAFAKTMAAEALRHCRLLTGFALIRVGLDWTEEPSGEPWDATRAILSKVVVDELRAADSIGRVTGEEIAILCPQTTLLGAARIAQRILSELRQEGRDGLKYTASVGLADTDDVRGIDLLMLWDAAGEELARARQAGGNRIGGSWRE